MGAHKERKGEETPDPFTGFLCVLHKIKTYKKTWHLLHRLEDTLQQSFFSTCLKFGVLNQRRQKEGWRMVKSETHRDAKTLVRNPSPRLFGKKFRDLKKVKTNQSKMRLRDLPKTLPIFRDPVKIFRDPRFLRYHSPPLKGGSAHRVNWRGFVWMFTSLDFIHRLRI